MITTQKIQLNTVKSAVKAFTLIESLLVLAITSFLIIAFSLTMMTSLHRIRGNIFVAEFERTYRDTQFIAGATHSTQEISASKGFLHFQKKTLKIPEEVQIQDFSVKFDEHGNNSSLSKITLYLPEARQTLTYQLQMGSGLYKKTIN